MERKEGEEVLERKGRDEEKRGGRGNGETLERERGGMNWGGRGGERGGGRGESSYLAASTHPAASHQHHICNRLNGRLCFRNGQKIEVVHQKKKEKTRGSDCLRSRS